MKALSVELVPRDASSVVFGVVLRNVGDVDRARLGQRLAAIGGDGDRHVDKAFLAPAGSDGNDAGIVRPLIDIGDLRGAVLRQSRRRSESASGDKRAQAGANKQAVTRNHGYPPRV